jgi:hypothetical protein
MDEISCCGLNCSKCVSYKGKYAKKAKEILGAIERSNMDGWHDKGKKEPEFSWQDFKKGLQWFSKTTKCAGCKECGAVPNCMIRVCCSEKKVENCSKCNKFPCDKVSKFKEAMGIDVVKNFSGD